MCRDLTYVDNEDNIIHSGDPNKSACPSHFPAVYIYAYIYLSM